MVKLAEDRFALAVLGQFKRGKSSLMNAIVGREVLPTGVLPLTSAITILKFGPVERLLIHREDWSWPQEEPLSQLAQYVTEKGNPGNVKQVKMACVELPLPFLRRGLEFVDTPGVGSAIEANTATTYGFLPNCDAVIFVTSVDTPLTAVEIEFLQRIRQHVHKVFFVVNKMDLLGETERQEVLEFISETIRRQVGDGAASVFPLSSRLGLAARMAGDADAYAQSGLKDLEETLATFLSEEKAATFLTAIIDKAARILADESGEPCPEPAEGPDMAVHKALDAVRTKLTALRDSLFRAEPSGENVEFAHAALPPVVTESLPRAAPEPTDIAADLKTRGCPACRHLVEAALDLHSHWQYALASDESVQAGFAAELGFCPLHTWQLLAMSSPHGASLGYTRLVDRVAHDLATLPPSAGSAAAIRSLLPGRNCRVCQVLRETEQEYVARLASFLQESENMQAYIRSQGLCLRHLGLVVAAVPDEVAGLLLSEASRHFAECAEDMQSFSLKHEAIRRALHNRDEEDAYLRAIIHLVGERNVQAPSNMDGEI
jgi:GTP-binding protein EngB required for normal cell division